MKQNVQESLLKDAQRIVSQCDRCGSCRLVCPLFGVRDIEAGSARGKNNIIRALAMGGLEPTAEVAAAVDFCLLCRACVDNCPSKVKTDEAMIAVRQHFADLRGGTSVKYKLLGTMLKKRGFVKIAAGAMDMMRRTGINRIIPKGVVPAAFTRQQFLAAFAGPAAIDKTAPVSTAMLPDEAKVAYFYGCGMRMMFPEAAADTLAILRSLTEVRQVENVCCGLPHLAHGLRQDFLDLAKKNICLYEDADVIVSDCASCSSMLKHLAGYFAEEPEWRERALIFSQKVMDLSEYLMKAGYQPRQRMNAKMTFHEPCHLGRGQGIKSQPRKLLQAAGEYIEMAGADTCCGGAGSFHMDYPSIADQVLAKKQAAIEQTSAQIVVTACPVCLSQMSKAAERSGGRFRAMHISQVI